MKPIIFVIIILGAVYYLAASFGLVLGMSSYKEGFDRGDILTNCLMVPNGSAILEKDKIKCQAVLDFYKSKGNSGTQCLDELFPASNLIIKNSDLLDCSLSIKEYQANLLAKSLSL